MRKVVGTGKYTYEMDEGWAKTPEGWDLKVAAVAIDSKDRVFSFNRDADHPVVVFDREGNYLKHWGAGVIAEAHAILIDSNDIVWAVDKVNGQIMKFTTDGELLMTIGTKGFRSDTGADPDIFDGPVHKNVTRAGQPFNLPTGIAVAPSGEIFVSDGYANCQVHKFSPQGERLLSWGEPGQGPGQFYLPHGIWIDRFGQVMVADRENDRVQVFDKEGKHLSTWSTPLFGPSNFYVDREDIVFIPEHDGGAFSVMTLEGERLAQWGWPLMYTCHGVWLDSHRDLYVVQPGTWCQSQPRDTWRGLVRKVVKYHWKG